MDLGKAMEHLSGIMEKLSRENGAMELKMVWESGDLQMVASTKVNGS